MAEAIRNFRTLVAGAADDTGRILETGRLSPNEVGKLTIWQLRNLYSGRTEDKPPTDARGAYLYRHEKLGTDAFEVWRKWKDEIEPVLAAVNTKAQNAKAQKH